MSPRVKTMSGRECDVPGFFRRVTLFLAFIVFAFSREASGHGTDFLFAKLILDGGEMRLEMTADYESNPLIPDRSHAAAMLPVALQLKIGDMRRSLVELADVKLEERSQFDESAPLPEGTFDNSISHQLLTALWEWTPSRDPIHFTVPKGSKHDVLLWIIDSAKPNAEPRWMMLLGGDVSPPIELPGQKKAGAVAINRWMAMNVTAAIVIPMCGIILYRRRRRHAADPRMTTTFKSAPAAQRAR